MSKAYIERGAIMAHMEDLPTWGMDGNMLDREDVISSLENAPAADVVLTVGALADMVEYTDIKVMSAYNGKLLCKKFDPAKHPSVADREVSCIWAEINASKSRCFGNIARPILCVYANGAKEYEEEHNG